MVLSCLDFNSGREVDPPILSSAYLEFSTFLIKILICKWLLVKWLNTLFSFTTFQNPCAMPQSTLQAIKYFKSNDCWNIENVSCNLQWHSSHQM